MPLHDPITYIGAGTAGTGNNTSVTPSFHASTTTGDLVLIQASIRNSGTGTVNTPSGWTRLVNGGNWCIFGRFIIAGDTAPAVTFTGGAANADTIAQTATFRGVRTSLNAAVILANTPQTNASAQDIAYPAATISTDGALVIIAGWKQDDSSAVSTPPGFSNILSTSSTAGDDAMQTWRYKIQDAAANIAAGTLTITGGASAISKAVVLALQPDLGQPFLTAELGPDARILVEAAFGADLTASPTTWTWADITADVRHADGGKISIAPVGRSDESSTAQPAGCTFELDNLSSAYSAYNAESTWYPYVRRNTPIRVRVSTATTPGNWVIRFQGYATGWTPSWDVAAALPVVTVSAQGITRRLSQGKTPLSAMRRSFDADPTPPIAYWPLEGGKDAAVLYDVISGTPTEQVDQSAAFPGQSGAVEFGTARLGYGSDLVANAAGSWTLGLKLPQPLGTGTGAVSFQFHMNWGTTVRSGADVVTGLRLDPASAVRHLTWVVYFEDDKTCFIDVIEAFSDFSPAGAATTLASGISLGNIYDGEPRAFQLDLQASGGTNVAWQLWMNGTSLASGTHTPSFAGALNAAVYRVATGVATGSITFDTHALGHYAVYNSIVPADRYTALNAHRGETATDRITRLCAEQGVDVDITSTSDVAMGPQGIDSFLQLLRECETADLGVLYDGLGPGLGYVTRNARYALDAALTADMAASPPQIDDPFQPVDDDQRNRNVAKVDRKDGSSYTYRQDDGPLGTAAIGVYDTSLTINIADDVELPFYASWLTHLGTVEGFRYPTLNLDLAATPTLADSWLACSVASRININNVSGAAPQHAAGAVRLLLEGWAEQLSPFDWAATCNTSQYDPWDVGVTAEDSGDTNPLLGRLDADDAVTSGSTAASAATITVVTNSGPIWTTTADDFPFDVLIGGQRISISAITGAASPQTFTVDPTGSQILYTIPAGTAVNVADPIILAL